ncbi:MAG TPA: hypothetical protein VFT82_04155 [Candidatus Paceibacterota bacterium]|nr:hypothetical protein [Candidatus Paceibacterota bacterium]
MFERFFGGKPEIEGGKDEASALEVVRMLNERILFLSSKEKEAVRRGEKIFADQSIHEKYKEAAALLETGDVSQNLKEALEDTIERIDETYKIYKID